MKGWTREIARRAWPQLRPVAWLAVVALAYPLLRLLFTRAVAGTGLFSPSGLGDPVVLVLGLVVITLRLVLLFVAPAVVVYHVVSRVLTRWYAGRRSDERPSAP